jgi:uncharacterized YigZ family protein
MEIEAIDGDHYRKLVTSGRGQFKEKGSRFIGLALPVNSIDEATLALEEVKKEFHDARHWCFAYRINPLEPQVRSNDDGEPMHSAGTPILNQILSADLWNIMVVVVRYFGGTKLGVAGLIQAYKSAAQRAIEASKAKDAFIYRKFDISFPYSDMGPVMQWINKDGINIVKEKMGQEAAYLLEIRKSMIETELPKLRAIHRVQITELE